MLQGLKTTNKNHWIAGNNFLLHFEVLLWKQSRKQTPRSKYHHAASKGIREYLESNPPTNILFGSRKENPLLNCWPLSMIISKTDMFFIIFWSILFSIEWIQNPGLCDLLANSCRLYLDLLFCILLFYFFKLYKIVAMYNYHFSNVIWGL